MAGAVYGSAGLGVEQVGVLVMIKVNETSQQGSESSDQLRMI